MSLNSGLGIMTEVTKPPIARCELRGTPCAASRTLQANPNGPWTGGARYNLARTYEVLGDHANARAYYEQDKSPQRHGNLLRARRLGETQSVKIGK